MSTFKPDSNGETMRPVDLASSAGVSTQQVRNLEAAGGLPPAERSASGYRIYREEHLSALHCYQALVPGHGASSARAIMAAVIGGRAEEALETIDAGHAALQQQRRALDATAPALARVTEDLAESPRLPGPLTIGQLADLLGVRTSALRVWEEAGLLSPARRTGQHHRLYDAEDIRDARVICLLRQGHYRFSRIGPVIEELRGSSGVGSLRLALAERRAALTSRSRAMLHGAALLHEHLGRFTFGGDASERAPRA